MKQFITFRDVSLGYGDNIVLENINLDIFERDFIVIIGENGAGKTTLLKGLLGLLSPLSGEVKRNFSNEDNFSYTSQLKTISIDFPASVSEIVLSGRLKEKGSRIKYNKEDKNIANFYMKKLGIYNIKNKPYKILSGGQRQRVLMARALTNGGNILVLDEPTTGLDINFKKELYDLLLELNKNEGKTIIIISHDDREYSREDFRLLEIKHKSLKEL